jgi:PAS domain S-box-containing protein
MIDADILIVEDSHTQAEELKYLLSQEGCRVVVANNAKEALAVMNKRKPTMVISDILMPGMDGYEFCRRIRKDKNLSEVPVILLTQLSDVDDVVKGLECGADNFITKPYDDKYLLSRIQYVLLNRGLGSDRQKHRGDEIFFAGRRYVITSDRQQVLDFLLSAYETAIQKNLELIKTQDELRTLNERLEDRVTQRTIALEAEIAERRRAEEALRKLSRAVEQSPSIAIITDTTGTIEYVNPKFTEVTGYSVKEVIGKNPRILKSGETPSEEYKRLWATITSGGEWRGELHNKRRNGQGYWVSASISPIRDPEGVITHFVAVQEDITEHKRAEEALRQNEEKYRDLVDAVNDGFFMTNHHGVITFANRALAKIGGFERPEELIGRKFVEFVAPAMVNEILENFKNTIETGHAPEVIEVKIIRPDGRDAFVEVKPVPIVEGSKVIGTRGVVHDITERKQAEQERQRRHQELSTLYNIALAITRDPSTSSILNNTLVELTGVLNVPFGCIYLKRGEKFSLQAYRGFSVEEVERLDKLTLREQPWLAQVKLVQEPLNQSTGQIDAWEKARGIQTWVSVPLWSKNEIIGVIRLASEDEEHFTSADLSLITGVANQVAMALEKKALEQQLQHIQKLESVGRLAGGVAHDFNNLLTAITGYATLALSTIRPDDPASLSIQEVQKAAERAGNLTRQLLAFARRQVIEPKVINLNDLILDMEKMLHRLIGEDIELTTRPSSELWPIKVDPGQIEQVLVNLVVNARDAMPEGGKLTIETANVSFGENPKSEIRNPKLFESISDFDIRASDFPRSGQHVALIVSDTGIGMTDDVKTHLFEPFFTTKEQGKGTGLGLATCYGIVKQAGGYIEVSSEPSQGTTFKIFLPRVEAAADQRAQHGESGRLPPGTETVLLVEDEPLVRELAARVLREQGYRVLEAINGDEAVQLAQDGAGETIHLLLTDVVMPQMRGKDLANWLKVAQPEMKVLFVSGYTDETIARDGVLEDGIALLQKPFSPAMLVRKVREVLDN